MSDFREESRCLHELSDITLLVLCGLLADCDTFEEIYDCACDKEPILRRLLTLPGGVPSSYTLQRVFRHLNPVELEASLMRWGRNWCNCWWGINWLLTASSCAVPACQGSGEPPCNS